MLAHESSACNVPPAGHLTYSDALHTALNSHDCCLHADSIAPCWDLPPPARAVAPQAAYSVQQTRLCAQGMLALLRKAERPASSRNMQCLARQLGLWHCNYTLSRRLSSAAVQTKTACLQLSRVRAASDAQLHASSGAEDAADDRARSSSLASTSAPVPAPSAPAKRKGPKQKYRLDEYCLMQNPQYSRNLVQSWILQGKILVDDRPVLKSGYQVCVLCHSTLLTALSAPRWSPWWAIRSAHRCGLRWHSLTSTRFRM